MKWINSLSINSLSTIYNLPAATNMLAVTVVWATDSLCIKEVCNWKNETPRSNGLNATGAD